MFWTGCATDVDIALLLDAAFFPIQHIQPLIEHIAQHGYYLCKNGYKVGQWASDRCLAAIDCGREHAMGLEECSSYAVGINVHHELAMRLAHLWAEWCIAETIVGHHTSLSNPNGRNRGPVSDDPRVMGHRHDQTVLSILANRLGLLDWCERPRFTTYDGQATTEETVLLNRGGIA